MNYYWWQTGIIYQIYPRSFQDSNNDGYYGDEIELRDVPIPFDEVQDPQGKNMPDKNLSRDPARTPMQWDTSLNAGFTRGKPWLRIDSCFKRINVEVQKKYT